MAAPPAWLADRRLGLLCNQASTDRHFAHSRELINRAWPGRLTCLFSPQHGFYAEKQDNMVASDHGRDRRTDLPIFSLYGEQRQPTAAMFDLLDVLLVDLVDVGTRVYTFLYTLVYCLEAAARFGKQVVVLDRPNPLGGLAVEGNLLKPACRSFVGLYPLPMRHGLTLGELALLVNNHADKLGFASGNIGAELQVIPMQGWQRQMLFTDTGLPWVYPSPNMPTPATALVYPGQVVWEGTNVSEGRGTTLPFELCGAPFFRAEEIMARLGPLPGCVLRPVVFEPTANKWAGRPCPGVQIHVTAPGLFRPYRTTLLLLQAARQLYPDEFRYAPGPYEYEFERLPLDLILGDSAVRQALEQGVSLVELERQWQPALDDFDRQRRAVFLYD